MCQRLVITVGTSVSDWLRVATKFSATCNKSLRHILKNSYVLGDLLQVAENFVATCNKSLMQFPTKFTIITSRREQFAWNCNNCINCNKPLQQALKGVFCKL